MSSPREVSLGVRGSVRDTRRLPSRGTSQGRGVGKDPTQRWDTYDGLGVRRSGVRSVGFVRLPSAEFPLLCDRGRQALVVTSNGEE